MPSILVVTQFHCPVLRQYLSSLSEFSFTFRENDPQLLYREPGDFAAAVLILDQRYTPDSQAVCRFAETYRTLFIGNLPLPGRVDRMLPAITAEMVQALNDEFVLRGMVLDVRGLAAEMGTRHWYDERAQLFDMPWSAEAQRWTAGLVGETLRRYFFGRKKLLITDLDGVMWGGIVSQEAITLGRSGLGRAYRDYQRELQLLRESGILLAICSKNDAESVARGFAHPDMLLRPEDFVAQVVSWEPKNIGITRILRELDLAQNVVVFIDDNPLERQEIQWTLPEIFTPEIPVDPAYYAGFVRQLTCFDTLQITDEDRRRTELYQARAQRLALSANLDRAAFLQSLEMVVEIEPVGVSNMARFCELSQRTTQFTTTAKHYVYGNIPRTSYIIRLRDRFGDEGIVGGAVVDGRTLDCLFLSCRVIGRGVEDAFYVWLEQQFPGLTLPVVETARNSPARAWVDRIQKEGIGIWPSWISLSAKP